MQNKFLTALLAATALNVSAQNLKVQPEFWYSGFKNPEVQVLIYGENISRSKATITASNTQLISQQRVKNPNYLFLNLKAGSAEKFEIILQDSTSKKKKPQKIAYEIKERTKRSYGFSDKDFMCLIMPDRFANGDPNNDNMPGMLEKANNSDPNGRHGGDLKGIEDHIDYLKKIGLTAVWLNPVLENNMPVCSYHGYAITDFYKVDARFGTNEDYRRLAEKLRQNGIKLVMDMIFNHCGSNNFLYTDVPDSTWFHFWKEGYTPSNYRGTACFDPHVSKSDYKKMDEGWFDRSMPDINQKNDMFMTYLIQNSMWWAEYVGLDGIRLDTYPYNDKYAMNKWCKRMHEEFPNFSLLAECWLNDNPFTSYYAPGIKHLDGFESGLDHVTDFPLYFALNKGFNEENGWDTGIARVYQNFVSDFLQPYPEKNLVFFSNHDVDRPATVVKGDVDKLKMIYTIILTTRGIPCFYYGDEILYESPESGDGFKRQNMAGGWQGDKKNAFTGENLSAKEKDMQNFVTKLANFRKSSSAFSGKMIHFIPENGVYVYFRLNGKDKVMVIINTSDQDKVIDLKRFEECFDGVKSIEEVLGNIVYTKIPKTIKIAKKSPQVLKLNDYEIAMDENAE